MKDKKEALAEKLVQRSLSLQERKNLQAYSKTKAGKKAIKKAKRLKNAAVARARYADKIGARVNMPPAASPEFLNTYEWRRLRMVILTKYGSRCMCCGATPEDGVKMHVDHIKPRKLFPLLALDPDNLQVLCEVCNHGKGNWDMTDWRSGADATTKEYSEERIAKMLEAL